MTPLAFQNKAQGLTFLLSITFYTDYPPQKSFQLKLEKQLTLYLLYDSRPFACISFFIS